jgi:3-methyladenine DNA glycosylase AlkC
MQKGSLIKAVNMAESQPFKYAFGLELAEKMAAQIRAVYPTFDAENFVKHVGARVDSLELKGRISLIAEALRETLPADYPEALGILMQILGPENGGGEASNDYRHMWPIAQFVEVYGLEHYEPSMKAMYEITKRFSSEFAIRPYLVRYPEQTLATLHQWTKDENHHVRRLVSEGTRPRLPWGARLNDFIRDPHPVLALLEVLKDDPSPYVRKSVANSLNDIAKDHPELVVEVLRGWQKGASEGTRWIINHALRTLVKKGDAGALALLGYGAKLAVSVARFDIQPQTIRLGEVMVFTLTLINTGDTAQDLVIDYRIHFVKARGKTSPKVFKWTKATLQSGESRTLVKKVTLKAVTIRSYYAGRHEVDVQVNGQVLGKAQFELIE